MRRLVIDVEADSLTPKIIWCICVVDIDTGEENVFTDKLGFTRWFRQLRGVLVVGHNIIGFDAPAIRSVWHVPIDDVVCLDTLVCSRLFNYAVHGGHSLGAWGERLALPKGDFTEWAAYDDPARERERLERCVAYCLQDCRINVALFRQLEKAIYSDQWKRALHVEHEMAVICRSLHDDGFPFDYEAASAIHARLSDEVAGLLARLGREFPPRSRLIREVTPRATKFGTLNGGDFRWLKGGDLGPYEEGWTFSRLEWVPFNPGSPKQVIDRLNEAGWKPFEKTEGYKDAERELQDLLRSGRRERVEEVTARLEAYREYGWKISEENLATLPEDAPEGIQSFVEYRFLAKRLQTLTEWLNCYNKETGCIHGNFNHIGTWTGRMSHSDPNQGNVPSTESKYKGAGLRARAHELGKSMRALFSCRRDELLVGVDADAIQLRILAHYINDPVFTEALINGKKEDGTDAHTLNAIALGIGAARRADAKTFIYAWLLGAGVAKVAKVLGLTNQDAAQAVEDFIGYYPGLKRLKQETIPRDAARGYFIGIDGRIVNCDEYHMLAGYLQSGESCVMKHATVLWQKELRDEGVYFRQLNFVHDEWQTACRPADKDRVARAQTGAIRRVGQDLGVLCPLEGTAKFGRTWYDTH